MESKKKKAIFILVSVVAVTLMASTMVLAAPSNPGVEFGNWLQRNVAGVFVGVIAVIGISLLLARQLMKAVVALIFAAIGAILIFGGSEFAQKLGETIKSFF